MEEVKKCVGWRDSTNETVVVVSKLIPYFARPRQKARKIRSICPTQLFHFITTYIYIYINPQAIKIFDTSMSYACPISFNICWNHSCCTLNGLCPLTRSNSIARTGVPSMSSSCPIQPLTPSIADATPVLAQLAINS